MNYSPHRFKQSIYAYRYSADVVEAFAMKYARVINFIAKKLDMDPMHFKKALIHMFMYNNLRWNVVRETLKRIQNRGLISDLAVYDKKNMLKYLTSVRVDVEESWLNDEIYLKSDLTGEKF